MKTHNLEESAAFLHVSPFSMLELFQSGEVAGAKIGKQWVTSDEALEQYVRDVIKRQTDERRGSPMKPRQFVTTEVSKSTRRPRRPRNTHPPALA